METNAVVPWKNDDSISLPKRASVSDLVNFGTQLTTRDQKQIIKGFQNESYEMVSTFVWTKAINLLKHQLGRMGMSFIAELLDRSDIHEHSNVQQSISELEAIRLAEELGIVSGTAAFRLRTAMETIAHFNQPDLDDDPENDLSEEEAKLIVRSCIQSVLAHTTIDAAIDFRNFRRTLEDSTLTAENSYIVKLLQSPYFFHRTTLRILLSLIKNSVGAQLENALGNSNLIIPKIWPSLKHPEKYQVGRSYSELFTDGKNKAASGLKQVLLKVKGFDFVPEDLRSSSFIKAANEVISAHERINNFYNEPAPLARLSMMGSVIPVPAFSICMTAILSVRLGNKYGVADAAQETAIAMLKQVTHERWVYFFQECLPSDDRILYKLTLDKPSGRWIKLFSNESINRILTSVSDKDIQRILKATQMNQQDRVNKIARELYAKIGYTAS